MICAKPGFNQPMTGQKVYVLLKDGKPVGVTLRYTSVVRWMGEEGDVDDVIETRWLG